MIRSTGRRAWMVHSARSTVRRKLSATSSALKQWALMSGQTSRTCTNIKKVVASILMQIDVPQPDRVFGHDLD